MERALRELSVSVLPRWATHIQIRNVTDHYSPNYVSKQANNRKHLVHVSYIHTLSILYSTRSTAI